MDKRIEKTKRSIYDAFVSLREKKPLEKLTVKELCEETVEIIGELSKRVMQ